MKKRLTKEAEAVLEQLRLDMRKSFRRAIKQFAGREATDAECDDFGAPIVDELRAHALAQQAAYEDEEEVQ